MLYSLPEKLTGERESGDRHAPGSYPERYRLVPQRGVYRKVSLGAGVRLDVSESAPNSSFARSIASCSTISTTRNRRSSVCPDNLQHICWSARTLRLHYARAGVVFGGDQFVCSS